MHAVADHQRLQVVNQNWKHEAEDDLENLFNGEVETDK